MDGATPRERLRELLRDKAVLHGDFLLSAGGRSNIYLDARRVTLSAAGSGLVAILFLEALAAMDVDAVAGLAVGADPIVASIAAIAGIRGLPIDGLIVRKEMKQHGVGGRIVGPWREGLRVAIVDDTFTTGASALTAAEAIREEGGTVVGIIGLIDREQCAREAIESAGYAYHPIYSVSEILL